MSELKKCPFCGNELPVHYIAMQNRYVQLISCPSCYATISCNKFLSDRDALATWNSRPIEDALTARIAELDAAQRWVMVSERLPQIGVRVLFYNSFIKNIHKGWYSGDEWVSEIGVFYNGDKLKRITHWMPLPESPNDTQTETFVYGKERER